jgi:phospholipid-binding lipoprotein MlaA
MKESFKQKIKLSGLTSLILLLAGCASNPNPVPEDPYEGFNRGMYAFNRGLDKVILKPVAKTYDFVLPPPVKKGVSNFFSNIGDIMNVPNDLLQANMDHTTTDVIRVVVNSTIGILGIFDPATKFGLQKHYQDFGLTLAKWGCKDAPYIMLPFFGPSTLRDAPSMLVDYVFDPTSYFKPDGWKYALKGTRFVDKRVQLLKGDKLIQEAFDPYVLIRDAYLQRRAYLMKLDESVSSKEDTIADENVGLVGNK